jgi:exosortase
MASVADKLSEQTPVVPPPRSIPWVMLVWLGGLLIAANYTILKYLVLQWWNDEDMGHGFFVPVVAAILVWQRREKLLAMDYKPAWGWGIAVLLWGMAQGYVGMIAAELFLQRTSVLILLVGILLLTGGTALVRALLYPLLLLPFMIPIPTVVYNRITFPLQLFASSVAEQLLELINIPVLRDGNVLHLASQDLSVAEACSGIRSLLSLSFLSLVYSYFFDRRIWMRWALFAATIPIAILANAGRVTITGILSEINPEWAHGFFHSLEGWVIFVIAAVMLVCLHGLLGRIARFGSTNTNKTEKGGAEVA